MGTRITIAITLVFVMIWVVGCIKVQLQLPEEKFWQKLEEQQLELEQWTREEAERLAPELQNFPELQLKDLSEFKQDFPEFQLKDLSKYQTPSIPE